VLVDNYSSLNVISKTNIENLSFDSVHMRPSIMIVRGLDESKRGNSEINLQAKIRIYIFQIVFQVIN